MLAAMAGVSKAVLITGCSTGIGQATATRLLGDGWTVYATARRPETLSELAAAGAHTLALDVTDEASMRAAVEAVEQAEGALGVLVNNAGYSQSGAVETVPMEAVRRQFETNVFGRRSPDPAGAAEDARSALGQDRQRRLDGRAPDRSPARGHYHATKHALEAISDALRFELHGFGIDVIAARARPDHDRVRYATATGSIADGVQLSGDDPYGNLQHEPSAQITKARPTKGPMATASAAAPTRVAKSDRARARSPPAELRRA